MAQHGQANLPSEKLRLNEAGAAVAIPAWIVGVIGVGAAAGLATVLEPGFGRFYHAYLISFMFVLALALGGLFLTMVTHLVRAGWIASIRRIPETLAATIPYLGILALPIIISVMSQDGSLYPWAVSLDGHEPEHHAAAVDSAGTPADDFALLAAAEPMADAHHGEGAYKKEKPVGYHTAYGYQDRGEFTEAKRPWLNPVFFSIRIVGYFIVWSILARMFYGMSRRQDETGDPDISRVLSVRAALGIVVFALTVTYGVFDLIMSLDHHWYSTIFGVYYFAGAMIGVFASTIVILNCLQRTGYLTGSVTTEHYHDLGKFMFGFIFFWGYIGFSQYMLQWYANLPETTPWWIRRGVALSVDAQPQTASFGVISLALLFGHLLIPFAFLISRHIKRNRDLLLLAAVWMLVFCWLDLYWLIAPELNNGAFYFPWVELAAAVGVIGLFVGIFVSILGKAPLRSLKDPRLGEALAFQNI